MQQRKIYIRKKDFAYFENLLQSLDEPKRQKFIKALARQVRSTSKEHIIKVYVIDDFDKQAIDLKDFIYRGMINKTYQSLFKEKISSKAKK